MASKSIRAVIQDTLKTLGTCKRCGAWFEGPQFDGAVVYWPMPNSETQVTGYALCATCLALVDCFVELGPNGIAVLDAPRDEPDCDSASR